MAYAPQNNQYPPNNQYPQNNQYNQYNQYPPQQNYDNHHPPSPQPYSQPPPPQQNYAPPPSYGQPANNSYQTNDNNNNNGYANSPYAQPEQGQEEYAGHGQPQPGWTPQPHPPVTLYYGYTQQDSLLSPQNVSLEESTVPAPKCQDPCCAVFFILNMIAFAAMIIWGFTLKTDIHHSTVSIDVGSAVTFYGIAALISVICSSFFLFFARTNASGIIVAALILNALSWVITGAFLCYHHAYWGVVFIIFGLLMTLYPLCLWNRIKFVAVMIKYSITALAKYPGVFAISTIGTIFNLIISLLSLNAMVHVINYYDFKNGYTSEDHTATIYIIGIFMLFFNFYFSEWVRATIHTTIAGVVGTFWYLPSQTFATGPSFKRATTTSLGSIAFGSLLVALCRLGKAMARMKWNNLAKGANGKNSGLLIVLLIIIACIGCLFACFERCLAWINHFAFTQVALYGTNYIDSGKRTVELFFNSGFTMIIEKDMTQFVIAIGSLLSMMVSTAAVAIIFTAIKASGWTLHDGSLSNEAGFLLGTTFFVTMYTAVAILTPLSSAVTATWVCWAEDGESLNTNHPQAFEEMAEAKNKVLGM